MEKQGKSVRLQDHIILLGTGNAHATRCYNTCFTLHSSGGSVLLVDAGGGNGIFTQLEKAGLALEDIQDIFVTHAHTDHLLGVVWLIRTMLEEKYTLRVWSHGKVLDLLSLICRQTIHAKDVKGIGSLVTMHRLEDGDDFEVGDIRLQCFDIHSSKELQYGFLATMPDGKRVCCLGDEPYNPLNRPYAEKADWLMSEAFCLYEDRDRFRPYEKNHSTALDAAMLAEELRVRNLLLYHTEDYTLDTRKEHYTHEAKTRFQGRVWVPDDLERIDL